MKAIDCFFKPEMFRSDFMRVDHYNSTSYFYYQGDALARYFPHESKLTIVSNSIKSDVKRKITNIIIKRYHEMMGLPGYEPMEPKGQLFMQGNNAGYGGRSFQYPYFRYPKPRMSSELLDIFSGLNMTVVAKNCDIDGLSRSVKDPNMLSYMPKNRLKQLDVWSEETREKYALSGKPLKILQKAICLTPRMGEKFLETFRVPELDMKVIQPIDIPGIYNCIPYLRDSTNSLDNSCMNGQKKEMFEYYVENAKGMVTAHDKETGALLGRALLWDAEIDGKGIVFMDRVYVKNHMFEATFFNFAKENGYYRKEHQSYDDHMPCISPDGDHDNLTMRINISSTDLTPYMDTFRYLNWDKDTATNDISVAEDWGEYYEAHDMNGSLDPAGQSTFWSEWEQESIPEDEAVQSTYNGWIRASMSVAVYPHGYIYPSDHDDICQDHAGRFILMSEMVLVNDLIYHQSATVIVNGTRCTLDQVVRDEITGETILVEDAVCTHDGRITHPSNTVIDDGYIIALPENRATPVPEVMDEIVF